MNANWQVLIDWLHISSGIVWVGGYTFATVIVWPLLLSRPADQAIAIFDSVSIPISKLMGGSAQAVFWLGLLRGTVFGPVKSFHVLVSTSYGHAFMGAIILTLVAVVISAISGTRLRDTIFDGDDFREGGASKILRTNYVVLTLFALILICMVAMRHGL